MGRNRLLRSWKPLLFTGAVLVFIVLYHRQLENSSTADKRFLNSRETPVLLCLGWVASLGYLVRLQRRRDATEAAPQNRDILLNAIMEGGQHGIVIVGQGGTVTSFNRAAERIMGCKASHFLGRSVGEMIGEIHVPSELKEEASRLSREFGRPVGVEEVFYLPFEKRDTYEKEWTIRRVDGGEISISLTLTVLRDADGKQWGNLAIFQDISERMALGDAVRKHAMLLNAVMDGGNHGVVMTDENRKITVFNKAMERIFGHESANFVGRDVSHFKDETFNRAELEAEAEKLGREFGHRIHPEEVFRFGIQKYGTFEREWTVKRRDGLKIPILLTATPILDQKGDVYGSMGIYQDISRRKELENVRNDFISTASHELRTPLTSIRGALGLVSSGVLGELPGKISDVLTIAQKNCERLVRIINDILDVEKIEAGRLAMNIKSVVVSEILGQALEANRDYVGRYDVRLVVKDAPREAAVRADADRLMQIMANLISNAAKFSLPGAEVWLGAECKGNRVCFFVRDFGEGIPGSFRGSIFEKFAQADHSNTRHNEGTGLGLNIARRLVEMMHGSIRFETEIGEGTTFFFDLPLVESGS